MDTLEERLVRDLTQAAEAADFVVLDRADIAGAVDARGRRRRVRRTLVGAAVLLVAAGVASVVIADDAGRTRISDHPSTTTTQPTTTTTAPTTSTSSSTSIPVSSPPVQELLLSGEGVGGARIGDPADGVVDGLSAALGDPTRDTGAEPLTPRYRSGGCDGVTTVRRVEWPGLVVEFVGPSADELTAAWFALTDEASPVPVRTLEGLELSDPLSDWEAAYPDRLTLGPEGLTPEGSGRTITFRIDDRVLFGYTEPGTAGRPPSITLLAVEGPCSPGGD